MNINIHVHIHTHKITCILMQSAGLVEVIFCRGRLKRQVAADLGSIAGFHVIYIYTCVCMYV